MKTTASQHLVLSTKLRPPRPASSVHPSARLLAALERAAALPLTLVIAPAGYGKTTLVASWLASLAEKQHNTAPSPAASFAWLSFDEYDQDPAQVLTYLVNAIQQACPEGLPRVAALLGAAGTPLHIALQTLLAELETLPGPLTLVLDDYDMLGNPDVHQLFGYLLRHVPANCRLILLSRSDPPLPLARLRVEGRVADLRANDLRLSAEESLVVLAAVADRPLAGEEAQAVLVQMEGWAIGLQLAGLMIRAGRRPAQAAQVAAQQSAAYLVEEVLSRQPPAIQEALLTLAVTDRFCASLCAALLGRAGAGVQADGLIEQLVRANLFVVSLDVEGRWYRYHQLFRDLLRHHLTTTVDEEQVRELHRRAARWFAAQGLVEEALRHFSAVEEYEAAADCVEYAAGLMSHVTLATPAMRRWIEALPGEVVARRPNLLLFEARLYLLSFDREAVAALLPRLEALLAAEPQSASPGITADLETLAAFLAFWRDDFAQAIVHCERAMQGPAPTRFLSHAFVYLCFSLTAVGRQAEAVQMAEADVVRAEAAGDWREASTLAIGLTGLYVRDGALDDVRRVALRTRALVEREGGGRDMFQIYALYNLGWAAYEQDDLDVAAAQFERLAAQQYLVAHVVFIGALIGLGWIDLARGDLDAALALVARARASAQESRSLFLRGQVEGFALRVALARGDRTAVAQALAQLGPDERPGVWLWYETPELHRVRALLLAGGAAELARADALAAAYAADVEALHNTRLLIAGLAVRALVQQARGDAAGAQASLARALQLGESRGFIRTFVDLGAPAATLIRVAAAKAPRSPYLSRLLAAFERLSVPESAPRSSPALVVPELLTPREHEVLLLIAERLSQQEIADRLVISLNTVKRHAATIYDKLGAHSRREAVAAARALGLLPPA